MKLTYEVGLQGYGKLYVDDESSIKKLYAGLVDTPYTSTHFVKIYDTDQIQWSLNPLHIQYIRLYSQQDVIKTL